MSNTQECLDHNKLEDKQINNEEKEITINIDEIDTFARETVDFRKSDNNGTENVNYDLEYEIQGIFERANKVEQRCAVLELVGNKRQPPNVWVQYNQGYGGQSGWGGWGVGNPQYQGSGGGYGGGVNYDPGSRNYFVKFVFTILLVMLLITAAFDIIVLVTPSLKEFYQEAGLIIMIAAAIALVAMNYVIVCSACSRVPPCNFISLFIVVIAMSNLVAAITVRYRTNILILALLATTITVAVCLLLACSKFDFTQWYIYVVVILVVFVAISGIVSVTMLVMNVRYKPLTLVLLLVGTLLNVIILIMELQMILGGRSIEMNEDDYALAAFLLYTSIVDLFLKFVQMIGLFDND